MEGVAVWVKHAAVSDPRVRVRVLHARRAAGGHGVVERAARAPRRGVLEACTYNRGRPSSLTTPSP